MPSENVLLEQKDKLQKRLESYMSLEGKYSDPQLNEKYRNSISRTTAKIEEVEMSLTAVREGKAIRLEAKVPAILNRATVLRQKAKVYNLQADQLEKDAKAIQER